MGQTKKLHIQDLVLQHKMLFRQNGWKDQETTPTPLGEHNSCFTNLKHFHKKLLSHKLKSKKSQILNQLESATIETLIEEDR